MTLSKEWLMVSSNLRALARAADEAADDELTPFQMQKYFRELEECVNTLESLVRRYSK
ncbi:hypothetical protein JW887_00350 [Candidatus Dojkabacteria bacterium]|nr:hypothetical protein [Candidatus Dojkabacteria bacterium]